MLTTMEGVYHDGKITLTETPNEAPEGRVLVVFLGNETEKPTPRQMSFGMLRGKYGTGRMSTEEDFKIAEWHGEEEFDDEYGGE